MTGEREGPPSAGFAARLGIVLMVAGVIVMFVFHHDLTGLLAGVGSMVIGAVILAVVLDQRK